MAYLASQQLSGRTWFQVIFKHIQELSPRLNVPNKTLHLVVTHGELTDDLRHDIGFIVPHGMLMDLNATLTVTDVTRKDLEDITSLKALDEYVDNYIKAIAVSVNNVEEATVAIDFVERVQETWLRLKKKVTEDAMMKFTESLWTKLTDAFPVSVYIQTLEDEPTEGRRKLPAYAFSEFLTDLVETV